MRKSALFIILAAIITGACGFFLRTRELQTVFDPVTGLAEPGAAVTLLLIGLSVLMAAVFISYAVLIMKNRSARNNVSALAPRSVAALAVNIIIALIMAAGIIHYAMSGLFMLGKVATIIFIVFAALTAAAYAVVPMCAKTGRSDGSACLMSVVPAVFFSLWLVGSYRVSAADPVLLDYCYECIALCALAIASYFQAGFVFSKARPAAAIATGLIAIYLTLVTMADTRAVSLDIILAAACCYQVATTAAIILRLKRK